MAHRSSGVSVYAGAKYVVVDVFARSKYNGNQLAVVTDGRLIPSSADQQSIAKEFNYPESTFLFKEKGHQKGEYKIRIYTPVAELPFAGHPLVGSAWVVLNVLEKDVVGLDKVTFHTGVGPLTITRDGRMLWLKAAPPRFISDQKGEGMPEFSSIRPPQLSSSKAGPSLYEKNRSTVLALLGLGEEDADPSLPLVQVTCGLPYWIIPLKDRAALMRASVQNVQKAFQFVESSEAKMFYLWCPYTSADESQEESHAEDSQGEIPQYESRMFGHFFGVPEDPATGSANVAFAAYLRKYVCGGEGMLGPSVDFQSRVVKQGVPTRRPSYLHLRAWWSKGTVSELGDGQQQPEACDGTEQTMEVSVGGEVVQTLQGSLS
uniref:Uncharacterized protein n=1 Tax=Chromera velia CCMP2878 TaxID=1169474 RepID=A0A0G4HTG7_9ALVE|eukprot:Cvel_8471.t1-p1 / transcript=Cvel_8471.t1 / gene=Cvel_8471 / organism=Chromera_velia_CCMP2878 / gene_product=Uncharacterized isomerase mll1393, putative / transcript_product=Uncharacterized isomerase mll1393, putative / location=Cvel_scaffold468:15765-17634(-) / protein_length=374 / sequence_SO=supercontig / SO=protein_coding / is_pseudo=false